MTLPPPDPDAGADLLPGEVPAALFDLAVNRASAALRGVGAASQERALSEWHARTRFARRVPLGWVAQALATRPSVEVLALVGWSRRRLATGPRRISLTFRRSAPFHNCP
ncbi:hypothetical protein [Deinococcus radiophilus]|uniref:hypothetical protein n=1 Tax=Deinococcus radiophilus TaxID=32062 RepID=UPI0036110D05